MEAAEIILAVAIALALANLLKSKQPVKEWLVHLARKTIERYQLLLTCGFFLAFLAASDENDPLARRFLQFAGSLLGVTVLIAQIVQKRRADRLALKRFRLREGLCIACGYDVRQSSAVCSECGLPVPVVVVLHNDDVHTFDEVADHLVAVVGVSRQTAMQKAGTVHQEGLAIIAEAPAEEADMICRKLTERELRVSVQRRGQVPSQNQNVSAP